MKKYALCSIALHRLKTRKFGKILRFDWVKRANNDKLTRVSVGKLAVTETMYVRGNL